MEYALLAFSMTCLIGSIVFLSIPGAEHRIWVVILFLLLAVMAFGAGMELLGSPRPIAFEPRRVAGLPMAGIVPDERGRVVYVMVLRDGAPVLYSMPWPDDKQKLAELMQHWRRREKTGETFYMTADDRIADVELPPPEPPKDQQP